MVDFNMPYNHYGREDYQINLDKDIKNKNNPPKSSLEVDFNNEISIVPREPVRTPGSPIPGAPRAPRTPRNPTRSPRTPRRNFNLPELPEIVPPQPGLTPIGNSPFYMIPNEPIDPRDCDRYPNSPWCGGTGFSFKPIDIEVKVVLDNCNIGIEATPVLAFIYLPSYQIVYRSNAEECQLPPIPPRQPFIPGVPEFPSIDPNAIVWAFCSTTTIVEQETIRNYDTVPAGVRWQYQNFYRYSYLTTTTSWSDIKIPADPKLNEYGVMTVYPASGVSNLSSNGYGLEHLEGEEEEASDYSHENSTLFVAEDIYTRGGYAEVPGEGRIQSYAYSLLTTLNNEGGQGFYLGRWGTIKKFIILFFQGVYTGGPPNYFRENNNPHDYNYFSQTFSLKFDRIIALDGGDPPPHLPPPPPPPEDPDPPMPCCSCPDIAAIVSRSIQSTLNSMKFNVLVPVVSCEYDESLNKWEPFISQENIEIFAATQAQANGQAELHFKLAEQAIQLCESRNLNSIPGALAVIHENIITQNNNIVQLPTVIFDSVSEIDFTADIEPSINGIVEVTNTIQNILDINVQPTLDLVLDAVVNFGLTLSAEAEANIIAGVAAGVIAGFADIDLTGNINFDSLLGDINNNLNVNIAPVLQAIANLDIQGVIQAIAEIDINAAIDLLIEIGNKIDLLPTSEDLDINVEVINQVNVDSQPLTQIVGEINNKIDVQANVIANNVMVGIVGALANFDAEFNLITDSLVEIDGKIDLLKDTDINVEIINQVNVDSAPLAEIVGEINNKIDVQTNVIASNVIAGFAGVLAGFFADFDFNLNPSFDINLNPVLEAIANIDLNVNFDTVIDSLIEINGKIDEIINTEISVDVNTSEITNTLVDITTTLARIEQNYNDINVALDVQSIINSLVQLNTAIVNISSEITNQITNNLSAELNNELTIIEQKIDIIQAEVTTEQSEETTVIGTIIQTQTTQIEQIITLINDCCEELKEAINVQINGVIGWNTDCNPGTPEQAYFYNNTGLLGIKDYLDGLHLELRSLAINICSLKENNGGGDVQCFPVFPGEQFAEFDIPTQLVLTFGQEYPTQKGSLWHMSIPLPINVEQLDWNTHFEPMVRTLGEIQGRIYFNRNRMWVGCYADTEQNVEEFLLTYILPLCTLEPQKRKDDSVRVRTTRGGNVKRLPENREIRCVRAVYAEFDSEGNIASYIKCFVPPLLIGM